MPTASAIGQFSRTVIEDSLTLLLDEDTIVLPSGSLLRSPPGFF
jgi:hypothetical protein